MFEVLFVVTLLALLSVAAFAYDFWKVSKILAKEVDDLRRQRADDWSVNEQLRCRLAESDRLIAVKKPTNRARKHRPVTHWSAR
jgi:hypothetical protein